MPWGSLVSLGITLFGYYITGKKTKADLDTAWNNFSIARGKGNQSADDREDIQKQRERLNALKKEQESKDETNN